MQPYLLIDIDGVLCPYGTGRRHAREGYQWITLGMTTVQWSPAHRLALARLGDTFRLHWATGWEAHANYYFAPLYDLPPLPYISYGNEYFGPGASYTFKLPYIAEWASKRPDTPIAWIDDDIHDDAMEWAAERRIAGTPTLFMRIAPHVGLTDDDVEELLTWGREHSG